MPLFILLILLSLCFAVLQLNDPDPLVWTSVYTFNAIVLALVAKKTLSSYACLILAVLFALTAVYFWPDTYMGVTGDMGDHPEIEKARESLGLLILSCTQLGAIWIRSRSS